MLDQEEREKRQRSRAGRGRPSWSSAMVTKHMRRGVLGEYSEGLQLLGIACILCERAEERSVRRVHSDTWILLTSSLCTTRKHRVDFHGRSKGCQCCHHPCRYIGIKLVVAGEGDDSILFDDVAALESRLTAPQAQSFGLYVTWNTSQPYPV